MIYTRYAGHRNDPLIRGPRRLFRALKQGMVPSKKGEMALVGECALRLIFSKSGQDVSRSTAFQLAVDCSSYSTPYRAGAILSGEKAARGIEPELSPVSRLEKEGHEVICQNLILQL